MFERCLESVRHNGVVYIPYTWCDSESGRSSNRTTFFVPRISVYFQRIETCLTPYFFETQRCMENGKSQALPHRRHRGVGDSYAVVTRTPI
jgi:hypothetical protein